MELQVIQSKIYEVRGEKVILDFDLANLYQVETKRLKEAVRRNIERFEGTDFMFELTPSEMSELSRSQIATLNKGRGSNMKYMPFAFSELGVAMLSSVLRSETAINVNRSIMRAFVTMRNYLTSTATLSAEVAEIRAQLQLLERNDNDTLQAVNDLSEDMRGEIETIYTAIAELSIRPAKFTTPRRPMGYRFDNGNGNGEDSNDQ